MKRARPQLAAAKRREYASPVFQHAMHKPRREGDEIACSCGKRWPVGEDHP